MVNWNERNQSVIESFRASGGKSDGPPLLLLTTIGAKSGRRHVTPLNYLADGERYVIFASKAGGPTNPDWYHNLVANRTAIVEVGTETFDADAIVTAGEERTRLYRTHATAYPVYAELEQKTTRTIPVIALVRKR